jgi:WS/DGAT/MGAT family acyltransferase
MSATDQGFLLFETPERPMNIGALLVLAPPARARGGFADRLVARMLECRVGPPFSYRVKPGPVQPLLVFEDDPDMDPRRQVHRHALRRGSDLQTLFAKVCELHAPLLPHDRPLWQAHVFTGLPDGRVALYFKTHHALIDGMGFLRVMRGVVSTSARTSKPHAIWEGMRAAPPAEVPGPSTSESASPALADKILGAVAGVANLFWRQGQHELGLDRGLLVPFVHTPPALKSPPSQDRVLAHCRLPLAHARDLARRGDAKVNDVMLAVIDAALHRYLHDRGTPSGSPLVVDIPVALQEDGGTGNRIVGLQVPMGHPGATPRERLQQIVQETRGMKQAVRALTAASLETYSIASHVAASLIESMGLGALPMLANLVVSNPAGFEHRVYFNGADVELALPVSVVMPHQALNVTITTYMDELHVTFIALREAMPDLAKLATHTVDAVDQLHRSLARGSRGRVGSRLKAPTGKRRATTARKR